MGEGQLEGTEGRAGQDGAEEVEGGELRGRGHLDVRGRG